MERSEIKKLDLQLNSALNRFELQLTAGIAFVEFEKRGAKYFLTHTEVPEALMGQGIGSILVGKVIAYIENEKGKIVPYCPYIKKWVERNSPK